jgi:hypothetical protein
MEGLIKISPGGVKIYFDDESEEYTVQPTPDDRGLYYTSCYKDACATAIEMDPSLTIEEKKGFLV